MSDQNHDLGTAVLQVDGEISSFKKNKEWHHS